MSISSVQARVQSIHARIASLDPGARALPTEPAAAGASSSPFAATLGQRLATGASGSTTATQAGWPHGSAPVGPVVSAAGSPLGDPSPYDAEILAAAQEAGVPPALLKAMCKSESGFNPRAVSHAGAQGLMQLMPGTARGLGVTDPFDPVQSLRGGARYLRGQLDRFGGDVEKAVAAYNAGPGAVERHGGVPPYRETQGYVRRVLDLVASYGGLGGAPSTSATVGAPTAPMPVMSALAPTGGLPGASSLQAPQVTPVPSAAGSAGSRALGTAAQFLGTPYRWGGESPSTGFDCSGLVQYAYGRHGVTLPRTTQEQVRVGTPVAREALQPGDLVFFRRGGDVNHVGLYVGEGRFLHAPRTGDVVKVSSLAEPSYAGRFAGARRHSSGGTL